MRHYRKLKHSQKRYQSTLFNFSFSQERQSFSFGTLKKTASFITVFLITLGLSISLQGTLAGWLSPSSLPPAGGIANSFLQTDATLQFKKGGLWLNTAGSDDSNALIVEHGNIGINVTDPRERVHIHDGSLYMTNQISVRPDIHFGGSGVISADASIFLNIDSLASSTSSQYFAVGAGASTSAAIEFFAVNDEGNVGIGTLNPARDIDIRGYNGNSRIYLDASGRHPYLKLIKFDDEVFTPHVMGAHYGGSSTAITATKPNSKMLSLIGVQRNDNYDIQSARIEMIAMATTTSTHAPSSIIFSTGNEITPVINGDAEETTISSSSYREVMRLDPEGRLGLKRSNPKFAIDVNSGEGIGINTVASTTPDIYFYQQGVLAADHHLYLNIDQDNNGTGALYIAKGASTSNATELLTVLNNGNVGIGVSSPTSRLVVGGRVEIGSTTQDYLVSPSPANWNYNLILSGQDNTSIGFHDSDASVSSIRYNNSGFVIGGNDGWGVRNVTMPGQLNVSSGLAVGMANNTYSNIYMFDDETPNGYKYIHANSNNIGFLGGDANWLVRWDENHAMVNYGTIYSTDTIQSGNRVCDGGGRCLDNVGGGFGGAYWVRQGSGTCSLPNPRTGGCSCAVGSPFQVAYISGTFSSYLVYICF